MTYTLKMAKITKLMVGESLVGDGNELCHFFLEEDRLRSHCQRQHDTP